MQCAVLGAEVTFLRGLVTQLTAKPESLATNPELRRQAVAMSRFPDAVEDALSHALQDQPKDIVRQARVKAARWLKDGKSETEVARLIQVGDARVVTDDFGAIVL